MEDAHAREVEDVVSYFGTDVHTGLSDFEVSKASSWETGAMPVLTAAEHYVDSSAARVHGSNTHVPPCRPGRAMAATSCPMKKVRPVPHYLFWPMRVCHCYHQHIVAGMLSCSIHTMW